MRFQTPLIEARLIRRYKRFLADCRLPDGREVVAHCPNPGAMTGLAAPGTPVWLEPNDDRRKKLRYGWRLAAPQPGHWAAIDTGLANRVVREALEAGRIAGLPAFERLEAEVPYAAGSRVDFLLSGPEGRCWVEVKSVTLMRQPGRAEFPDTKTARGAKHLAALTEMAQRDDRAVMLYLLMRSDCDDFALASDIDPAYARAAELAARAGVDTCVVPTQITTQGIEVLARTRAHGCTGTGPGAATGLQSNRAN